MARYALVVGIEKYKDRHLNDLTKAVADATEVAEILEKFGQYKTTLLTGEISDQRFADEIKKLLKQGTNQEVVIYFSGHGLLREEPNSLKKSSPEGFLAASNSTITKKNDQCTSIENGLKIKSIVELIPGAKLSNLVFILDACHSGSLIKEIGKQFKIFSDNNTDYAILAACQDYEVAWAKIKDKYSLFTGALLNALKKDYIDDNGKIQLGGVADRVYAKLKTSRQEPICLVKGKSFPFLTYPFTFLMNDSVQKKKVSLEAIRSLKQILKLIDNKILAWSLLESLSYLAVDTWLEKDKLMGSDSFIETIEENSPQLDYEFRSLFKVVENLANHPKIVSQTQNQLKSWFSYWTKKTCQDIIYSRFTPYLMVVITQERPNDDFKLMAFLRIENKYEIPIKIRSSLVDKTYEQNTHNPNLCTCKKWENVLDWLRDIIKISENFYLKGFPCAYELNIELFLPFDYLTEEIDLWKIKKQGKRDISLAQKYPCMIRAWDRLTDGDLSNKLEQIWSLIKNDKNPNILDQLKRLEEEEDYDYSLLESDLFEQEKWGITCNLPSKKADYEELFYAILDMGIPLAVWVRPNSCNCEFGEIFNQPIQVIEDLVKMIVKKRKKAHLYRRNPESKWAYHLVIWLDNPDRIPNISLLQTPNR